MAFYPYLIESDHATVNSRLQSDIANGVLRTSDRLEWGSRYEPVVYPQAQPRGGAGAILVPRKMGEKPADGGSLIDIPGTSYRLRVDLNDKTNLYQWGIVGNGDLIDGRIKYCIHYLNAHDGLAVCDFEDAVVELVDRIDISNCRDIKLLSSGSAHIVKRKGTGAFSTIFQIRNGSENIWIKNLRMQGDYAGSDGSTGSSPGIMIGDYQGESTQRNIHVEGVEMSGFNWAAIMVYGKAISGKMKPLNEAIHINNNELSNSSNGIFVYKGLVDFQGTGNYIHDVSQDGVVFDTRAASDTEPTYAIEGVSLKNTTVRQFGVSAQGVGILLKGAVNDAHIFNSVIEDSSSLKKNSTTHNYGILVNQDAGGETPRAGSGAVLTNTVIRNIDSYGGNGIGLFVGENQKHVLVDQCRIESVKTCAIFFYKSSGRVVDATIVDCRGKYAARFEGLKGDEIEYIQLENLQIELSDENPSSVGLFFSQIRRLYRGDITVSGMGKPELVDSVHGVFGLGRI